MSILTKLTEGIRSRDLQKEGDALLSKWEKTGLLEGLSGDVSRNGMARLLENQASQLLKEASSMSGGDVEGFASVAFPLVRRVFGGLLANDLVSVQPMSLPSGLIFFLDFTHTNARADYRADKSIYGGGVVASGITGGVNLGVEARNAGVTTVTGDGAETSFYSLNSGYSSPTGAFEGLTPAAITDISPFTTGSVNGYRGSTDVLAAATAISALSEEQKIQLDFDPDLLSADSTDLVWQSKVTLTAAQANKVNWNHLTAMDFRPANSGSGVAYGLNAVEDVRCVRRLTRRADFLNILVTWHGDSTAAVADVQIASDIIYPMVDTFATGTGVGSVVGAAEWGLEGASNSVGVFDGAATKDVIPEIDIKVDSIAVTAVTKKLKAKWSPELGQDLNAYHNLDAEVELTSILSEQIALEIDREILGDLVDGATAGVYHWSRSPGLFVHRLTGVEIGASAAAPDFTGTVSEWYETLIETINDVSAQIHRKTLRGGANFVVCGPEVANILEFTAGFRASVTADADSGTVGAVKTGSLSKKWDVYVDPYFPRNVVLAGRKGGSFLESGYVYAPYVPLQVTPTIFGTEDFVPRKGVMTRYAKKMVRPDMYGLVVVRGLLGESGS